MAPVQALVRVLVPEDVPRCAEVLESVRAWFGLPDSNRAFLEGLRDADTAVAVAVLDAEIVGFIALATHGAQSCEIRIMAVAERHHRRGIGRALLAWAEERCARECTRWLHVKTLGPSTPDAGFERTRSFYFAMGFEPLFESRKLWGPENAALILVKHLACAQFARAEASPGRPS